MAYNDAIKAMAKSLGTTPEEIASAGIVFAVDRDGKESIVYGQRTLERIIRTGRTEFKGTMRIPIDFETDNLEKLLALVEIIKGYHEYGDNLPPITQ